MTGGGDISTCIIHVAKDIPSVSAALYYAHEQGGKGTGGRMNLNISANEELEMLLQFYCTLRAKAEILCGWRLC